MSNNISAVIINKFLLRIVDLIPYPYPWRNPFESKILSPHGVEWQRFFAAEEQDPCPIEGWSCRPASARGTVFLMHGFRENCYNEYIVEPGERFVNMNFAVFAFDFRYHGQSGRKLPTFGFAESLDIAGAMNHAEENGFPKPYILHGASLGGLAAQTCAMRDERVAGAFLKSTPASAKVALAKSLKGANMPLQLPGQSAMLAGLINGAYGYDVVGWGDVKSYGHTPAHRPKIFYTIGDNDQYGYQEARQTYDHWYQDDHAEVDQVPSQAPDQRKWLRTVRNADHSFGLQQYPEMFDDVRDFLDMLAPPIQ